MTPSSLKNGIFSPRRPAYTSGGYSLVEIIIYMALFVTLSTVLVGSLFGMTKTYKDARVTNDLVDSAHLSMDRMVQEIRNANGIDMTTSLFGTSPGVLKLDTTESDGTPKTVQFDLSGNALEITDSSDGAPSALTGSQVGVTSLVFRNIVTAHGSAVRIEISIASLRSGSGRSVTYTDTVALRGAY